MSTQLVRDNSGKPIQTTVAWVFTVLTIGYTLPWAIAATRGKSNTGAIAVLNVLLGWTIIGWIVALAMAAAPHQVAIAALPMQQNVYVTQQVNQPAAQPVQPPPPPAAFNMAPPPPPAMNVAPPVVEPEPLAVRGSDPSPAIEATLSPPALEAPAIPAGWYPDTATPNVQRYWDGSTWTQHTAPS